MPDYQGLKMNHGSSTRTGYSVGRQSLVDDPAQMQALIAAGRGTVDGQIASFEQVGRTLTLPAPRDMPRCSANVGDQPVLPVAQAPLLNQMIPEVLSSSLSVSP